MNGIPSVLSGLLLLFFIPESPKFLYSQGDQVKTIKILQKINKINGGSENFCITGILKDGAVSENKNSNFVRFMWEQTTPLFKNAHLRNILTVSYLQFGFCLSCNGFWTFYPELLNKVYLWSDANPDDHATVCEVYDVFKLPIDDQEVCVEKLENSTFGNIVILEVVYALGLLLTTLLINRVGKLICMLLITIPCVICIVLVIFVNNPIIGMGLYMGLMAAGINISVTNAATVELFPTSMR